MFFGKVFSKNEIKHHRSKKKLANLNEKIKACQAPAARKRTRVVVAPNRNSGRAKQSPTEALRESVRYEKGDFKQNLSSVQSTLKNLLDNLEITLEQEQSLHQCTSKPSGIRVFVEILKSLTSSSEQFCLRQEAFDLVLHLFNLILISMENQISNFLTTEILLKASKLIFTESHKGKELVRDYIKTNPIFGVLGFWQEYFWSLNFPFFFFF